MTKRRNSSLSSHCNTLQHAATHCNTLQHTAPHCNTLQQTATHFCRLPDLRRPTGWRRLIGSPNLQIIFRKRATKYRSLLRKMTYKDKGSYESSPPCTRLFTHIFTHTSSHTHFHTHIYTHTSSHTYTHTHIFTHASSHTHFHTHIFTPISSHTHLHTIILIIGLFCGK